jgi:Kef-type K+ transport system membrane component KefB
MSVGDLALLGICGLAGPLLSANRAVLIPVVVGEILAGVAAGHTGFRVVHPDDPTLDFLSTVGFALLMFHVGLSVPLRSAGLRQALARGAAAAGVAAALAVPAGILAAALTSGPARVYVVVLASSSAALVLPILDERGLAGPRALVVTAWVTVADIAATLSLAFVLRPHAAGRAAVGTALVAAALAVVYLTVRAIHASPVVVRLRALSRERHWALDLRLALIVLFGLTWIASKSRSSGLIAGFGTGLLIAALGGRDRLDDQVFGIGEGFLLPIFFVDLGAKLDLRALGSHPSLIGLAAVLLACNLAVHVAAALVARQPPGAGLMATAQLGVPAAAVAIGLPAGVLSGGQAAALIAAALGSIALTSAGAALLAARAPSSGLP